MQKDHEYGCDKCCRLDAAALWEARRGFRPVAGLVEQSHFSVSILACPACGQPFVSIFCETIDWGGGDDPQYWILLPVSAGESGKLISTGLDADIDLIRALGSGRRRLHVDYPEGEPMRVSWGSGHLFIPPHD